MFLIFQKAFYLLIIIALLTSAFSIMSVRATSPGLGQVSLTTLSYRGTTVLTPWTTAGQSSQVGTGSDTSYLASPTSNDILFASTGISTGVPTPTSNRLATSNPGFLGFNGLTHRDQRLAGTGIYSNTQFNKEPPDQGLCVSAGYVMEAVNTAIALYSPTGSLLSGPTAFNQFFNLNPEIIRSNPPTYGDLTTDPRCYHDPTTDAWFLVVAQNRFNPNVLAFGPQSHLELAVSVTGDPTGLWNLFSIDTTDDGTNGTPSHAGCPCFGDFPMIGADANGFFLTTNEFQITNGVLGSFVGGQLYAMSKTALAVGTLPTVVHIDLTGALDSFSVEPAATPPGASYAADTEFFLHNPDSLKHLSHRIGLWALSGTSTLTGPMPSLFLRAIVLNSESYGLPPPARQKDGPRPLGTVDIPSEGGHAEKVTRLDTDEHIIQQVVYTNGMLWASATTVVAFGNTIQSGTAFFILSPSLSGGSLTGSMVNQGYVALKGADLMYPSVGVNSAGKGVMVFSLAGLDFFPSAAYTSIDAVNGAGEIHIAGLGSGPEDGFTGYKFFGGNGIARWGDYSAAVAAPNGSIWMAAEYIPNLPRTELANWGTLVGNVIL